MDLEFPVFVSERDSGRMIRYEGLQQMQRSLERIDVENSEYTAWDNNCRSVELRIRAGENWLDLSKLEPAKATFLQAVGRYAKSSNVRIRLEDIDSAKADAVFQTVEKLVQTHSGMGWLRRILSRF